MMRDPPARSQDEICGADISFDDLAPTVFDSPSAAGPAILQPMNDDAWNAAIQTLRNEQLRLKAELSRIDTRIGQLAAAQLTVEPQVTGLSLAPSAAPSPAVDFADAVHPAPPDLPPPLPPSIPRLFIPPPMPTPASSLEAIRQLRPADAPVPPDARPKAIAPPRLPTAPPTAKAAGPAESLEMRVGSYWLVRIGVAILLTGLVFLATYLYQTITPRLGPVGKIGLLYLASGALAGIGTWLTRRATEPRMKNFASVVEAGGLAAVFFTTYAAHYFPGLQIISSPMVAGALLLAWSGFIVWLSSRRQSPTLAAGAIALMGYTMAVHPMGTFSLTANLIVVAASLALLWRHRWSMVSYAALAASYGGYFYWRFFQKSPWSSDGLFWIELGFLAGYWVLFAASGFVGTEKEMPPRKRAFLVGLNNSAFFALATLLVVEFHRASFWKFATVFGFALLLIGALSHRRVDGATAGVYRMQGLLLITLAIVTYFSGWQLGLMLALQTAVLASAASWRCSRVLLVAAMLAGLVAVVAAIDYVQRAVGSSVILPVSLTGALLLAAGWIAKHRPRGETPELYPQWFATASALFTVLGPGIWFFAMWTRTSTPILPAALAAMAVAMTFGSTLLRLRLLPALGQLWFAAAVLRWFLAHGALRLPDAMTHRAPWWSSAALIAAALALGRWWRSSAPAGLGVANAPTTTTARAVAALGGVLIFGAAAWPWCSAETWLVVAPLLALAVFGAAVLLRDEIFGLASQLLLLAGSAALVQAHFSHPLPGAIFAFFGALAPLLFAVVATRLAGRFSSDALRQAIDLRAFYEVLSVLLPVLWIFDYLPRTWQPFALSVAAVTIFVLNRLGAGLRPFFFSVLGGAALLTFWAVLRTGDHAAVQNLAALVLLALPFAWARRSGNAADIPADPVRSVCLGALTLTGWRWVSSATGPKGGFYLAAAWAVYAAVLLGIGLAVRERVYRLAGFAILAATLIRVTVFDAWRLGVAYRMVSFIVLGAVLMIVGFLYNRYQDKLKEWL